MVCIHDGLSIYKRTVIFRSVHSGSRSKFSFQMHSTLIILNVQLFHLFACGWKVKRLIIQSFENQLYAIKFEVNVLKT